VAVNADSMATWFTGEFSGLDDVVFDVRIEDQDHSARLLREGVVMGAVTTERHPVAGCRVQPLGVMRYVPVADDGGSAVLMRTRLDAVGIGSHPISARRHHAAPSHGMTYSIFRLVL
jgi:LysR family transcriptional regulator (chromosome initiation inhibitor)